MTLASSAGQELDVLPRAALSHVRTNQGAYRVNTKSRSLPGSWQGKHVLCTASFAGFPSSNCANPHPPVDAYFFESFTINCTFVAGPATKASATSTSASSGE